jgi:pimeloyl-ACP methyl ester carboxylesterase
VTQISERDVKVRSGGLYFRDEGEGTPILFLHAFPLNGRMWELQLAAFCSRARVIAPDLPGFGLSPLDLSGNSLEDCARAVLDRLDELDVGRMLVVGLSMGGYLAFRLLEMAPDRIAGLVLADTKAAADTDEQRADRHRLAAEVEASGVDVAVDELAGKLFGATTLRRKPDLIEDLRAIAREASPAGLATALRALASRPDSSPLLPSITCPVACVVGAEDVITPPAVVRAMADRIPRAVTIVIPEAGHLPNLEAPAAFNRAVEGIFAAMAD